MNIKVLSKPKNKQLLGLIAVATVLTGGIVYYGVSQFGLISTKTQEQPVEVAPVIQKVTALGRLEPEAEIIKLSPPLSLDGDRIEKILVKEGDRVKAGQVIAILDSRARMKNAVEQAQEQVKVTQAKLAQVRAGAKTGDIQAQRATVERAQAQEKGDSAAQQETIARLQAQLEGDRKAQLENIARIQAQWDGDRKAQEVTINRLQAELNNAEAEFKRSETLFKEGAISSSLFDSRRLAQETARQQVSEARAVLNRINTTAARQIGEQRVILRRQDATTLRQINEAKVALNRIRDTGNQDISQAKATLESVAEVRPVDLKAAQAEVDNAVAALRRANTDYQAAYVRAPMAATILEINTRVGEKISSTDGIADLAQTQQMAAVAEVYQSDLAKVKVGQKAIITGQAFAGEVKGTVYQIGQQIKRQNVFSNQPGENLDRRVVEVKIRVSPEDVKKVEGLTNLQVQTAIEL